MDTPTDTRADQRIDARTDADGQADRAPPHVRDFLARHAVLTVATASPAGVPHAATMVYASDGLDLYFSTRPDTATTRNVDRNPVVAFTVDEYADDWSRIKGVQGRGECRVLLDPDAIRRALDLFREKFPDLTGDASNRSVYRITPSELVHIDNERAGQPSGRSLGTRYPGDLVYSVFRGLPERDAAVVSGRLRTVRVDAGRVVVRQGASADKFFIIEDGEVEVVRRDDGGDERRVTTLTAGQFFGEVAILRDTPRTATVRALVPTTLLSMDRETFSTLVAQSLQTTDDFDRVVRERLGGLDRAG